MLIGYWLRGFADAKRTAAPGGSAQATDAFDPAGFPGADRVTPDEADQAEPLRIHGNHRIYRSAPKMFGRALQEMGSLERFQAVAEALSQMTAEDAEEAIEVYQQHFLEGRTFIRELRDLMRRLGQIDGAAALERRRFEGPGQPARSEWRYIMSGWASVAPTDAARWLDSLEDGDFKEDMIDGLIEGVAQADIDQAAELFESLPVSQRLRNLDTMIWHQLQSGSFQQLDQWVEGFPSESDESIAFGRRAFSKVADRYLSAGTAAAAEWVGEQVNSPFLDGRTVGKVATRLAADDAERALEWISDLPGDRSDLLAPGVTSAVSSWAARNPDEVGLWLGDNPRSPIYDLAARSFVNAIAKVDSEAAEQWANTIKDDAVRNAAFESLGD